MEDQAVLLASRPQCCVECRHFRPTPQRLTHEPLPDEIPTFGRYRAHPRLWAEAQETDGTCLDLAVAQVDVVSGSVRHPRARQRRLYGEKRVERCSGFKPTNHDV